MKKQNIFLLVLASMMMVAASCSDDSLHTEGPSSQSTGIAFSSLVNPSRLATEDMTRADGSLVNRLETQLLPTQPRTYYLWDNETGSVRAKEAQYYVGIFGSFTGDKMWKDMTAPKPTADFFYNQKASIGDNGQLTYEPERFWSNKHIGETSAYQRASFWAYYPWNEAVSGVGDYGISITTDATGVGPATGMGKVKFTMHPDAAEQNDFLISDLVADCSRDKYPLVSDEVVGWAPKRVPLRFHHMLAQVRIYAFISGTDRMVYEQADGKDKKADATWLSNLANNTTTNIKDAYGNNYSIVKNGSGNITSITNTTLQSTYPGDSKVNLTQDQFVALGLKVPDEANCVRWARTSGVWDNTHSRRRADITYSLSLNNIHTQAIYEPTVTYADGKYSTRTNITVTDGATGSATVNHYIMNPYWFRFNEAGKRVMLNESYMYDYFEDTFGYTLGAGWETAKKTAAIEQDGKDWSNYGDANALGYDTDDGTDETPGTGRELLDHSGHYPNKHYNYAPGNILLVVPQRLTDDDVPNIVINATGKDTDGNPITAKVTINMLQMNIKWEAGFIYCYAFVDELMPGDDKVRGPETITVIFDPERITDQW